MYLGVKKNTTKQPANQPLKVGSRHEKELIIFFQKSTNKWYSYNPNDSVNSASLLDTRLTYLPLNELSDEPDFLTYTIRDVFVSDILIDNFWVTLLTYDDIPQPNIESKADESGLVEGKCNLKNITITFDGFHWFFTNKGNKVIFYSDIFKSGIEDNVINAEDQITFGHVTGYLTKAGDFWIFVLHRKQPKIKQEVE